MTFTANFTFNSIEELHQFIGTKVSSPSADGDVGNRATPVSTSVTTPATAQEKKPAKATAKGPKPEVIATTEKKVVPTFLKDKGEAPKEEKLSYSYVSQATLDAVSAYQDTGVDGREKVKELLNTFGVTKATGLTEEQWPEYIKRCGDLIKAAPKPGVTEAEVEEEELA